MWIEAPFTPAQVQTLNEYQFGVSDHGPGHPFLCGRNDKGHHGTIDGNRGLLIATLSGWRCLYCDHNQSEAFEPFTKNHEGGVRWGDLVIEAMPSKVDALIDQLVDRLLQANQPASPFFAEKGSARQRIQHLVGIALESLYRRKLAYDGVETRPGRAFSVNEQWVAVDDGLPPVGREVQALCRLSEVTNPAHPAFAVGYHIVRTTRFSALPSGSFMAESVGCGQVTHWRHERINENALLA